MGKWAPGLGSRDLLWIMKKRLEKEWERAAAGEKGNGVESPLRRRKIGLCVKSLCQSSSQCYQSPAALGQGADNPPREFRGGSTSAGLEGGTGSSTRGFVPSMTLHLQRHPGESLGSAQIVEIGREIGGSVQKGVLWL